jgi:hypothetical protein
MTKQEINTLFENYASMNKLHLQRNLDTYNQRLNTSHTIELLEAKNIIKRLNFNRNKELNYGIDGDANIHYEITDGAKRSF